MRFINEKINYCKYSSSIDCFILEIYNNEKLRSHNAENRIKLRIKKFKELKNKTDYGNFIENIALSSYDLLLTISDCFIQTYKIYVYNILKYAAKLNR